MCAPLPHFALTLDLDKMYGYKLAPLLDDGIPILIYNGDKDYICNWVGGLAWVSALQWTGKDSFQKAHNKLWYTTEGKAGGESKSFGPLTFLRVYDAGHMVPMDQPRAALDMITEFIRTKTID